MIIIGEKINSTIQSVRDAMQARDAERIRALARAQEQAGASYIDVNAGMFHLDEAERLLWLMDAVQEATALPLAIDSPSHHAIRAGLKAHRNGKPIINSITMEKERFAQVAPLAAEYHAGIIALCMDDKGMPETAGERVGIAREIIRSLSALGVPRGDVYIDPMIRPVGTGSHYGQVALDTIRQVKAEFPEVHFACGLSNVSYGLPARKLVNQAMLVAAMAAGLDGAILDPLDKKLMSFVYAAEALLGRDEYCVEYIAKFRAGELET